MTITIIITLIVVGLLLLLIELFVIPGISLAGIASIVFFAAGIIFSYKYYGGTTGNIILALTFLSIIITIAFALKPSSWKKISLQTQIDSKIEENGISLIRPGDKALTKSKLSPIGEIVVNGEAYEAESISVYIEPNQTVEIVKIEGRKIYVKPLN